VEGNGIIQTSEYGMVYIAQNGCRQEVPREGQIFVPPM